ncbi:MAG TPA: hypothetical protein VII51_05190 [Gaiellaceae bacterium]
MLKLVALASALGLGIAVPATGALHSKPNRALVEQQVLQQLNSGPDGRITRTVHCSAIKRHFSFSCVAVSTRSSRLDAQVVVVGDGLRTAWSPLQG